MKSFSFQSYGVNVAVDCSEIKLLGEVESSIRTALLGRLTEIHRSEAIYIFSITKPRGELRIELDGEYISEGGEEANFLHFFETMVRLVIAEHAVDLVFMHSGAVVWNGKAIIFPADSFSGKSTLVAEFVKRGAIYYSDEYAILDKLGQLHSFPRLISLRDFTDGFRRNDVSAESIGGNIGIYPIRVTHVLLLRYQANARFIPQRLSPGNGLMKMIPQAISLRFKSKFTLEVLNRVAKSAIISESLRGEAKKTVDEIADFVDKTIF